MQGIEKKNFERKTEISNIHFLIHPGFMHKDSKGVSSRGSFSFEEGTALLSKYVEQAKDLGADELMIVFTPTTGKEFLSDSRKKLGTDAYIEAIRQIKKIMGDRLIIIADQGDIAADDRSEDRERVWYRIKKIIEKRGFILSDQLTAEAYGEYWNHCVSAIASNMHLAAGMTESNPAVIRTDLTEFPLNPPPKKPNPKYKNIKLDLPK